MRETAIRDSLRPLFQPLTISGKTMKNRIVSTAHAPGYAENGLPGERYRAYHEEKAKGGVALTMFGGSSIVSGDVTSIYGQIDVSCDAVIEPFRRLAERVHRHDTLLMCQISHMGRRTVWDAGDWIVPIAPSDERDPSHHSVPRAMEEEDIARVIAAYAAAARRCAEGGLDGCELMVTSHLPGQFLSPAANRRQDAWGGPLKNRMRFLIEVLRAVRAEVPGDFIVSMRMSFDESSEAGPDATECLAVVQAARSEDLVDMVNVIGPGGATNASIAAVIPGMAYPLAPWLDQVRAFRRGIGVPVLHATRINDVTTAVHAIESGAADLVGMTRAHIADPYLVAKVMAGEAARIRPCVGAAYCIDRVYAGKDAVCLHNPAAGREVKMPHVIAASSGPLRKIVVVGGGPAGLEAARVARLRGHQVVLFEASDRLGGQVVLAHKAAWRKDLIGVTDWLSAEVELLGVELRFNRLADAGEVLAEKPDIVIDATGGVPRAADIPGGEFVLSGWDALTSPPETGRSVLVYDEMGAHQGVALADFLSRRGVCVEIASPDRLIGRELGASSYPVYLGNLARTGVTLSPNLRLSCVEREGNQLRATLRHEYSEILEKRVVDAVIAERGTSPNDSLFRELKPLSRNKGVTDLEALLWAKPQPELLALPGDFLMYRVGDAVASRDIHAAIYDALRLMKDV
jgi:2,4-dienoyl-CoA reductase-like NADH-dependent reductase (Old Yellow Enzyme family)